MHPEHVERGPIRPDGSLEQIDFGRTTDEEIEPSIADRSGDGAWRSTLWHLSNVHPEAVTDVSS
jgi:hypothetical protein